MSGSVPRRQRVIRLGAVVPIVFLVAAGCGSNGGDKSSTGTSAGSGELVGLFKVDAGVCSNAGVTAGSYFRMVQSGGNVTSGPYMPNGDSPCGDKTWSPLKPGTDGGLRTGAFQPFPQAEFDAAGNGLANLVTQPTKWFAVNFANATNAKDPQTKLDTTKPSITASGGQLSGDLRAFAAAWNKQDFNQGSPKPDGSKTGNTSGPTGTYDASSNHYTLQWTSQISGGPFNNFTGVWHLEGTFQAG